MNAEKEKVQVRKLDAEWTNDCCGKKDFDGEILSISTRYWPDGGSHMTVERGPDGTKVTQPGDHPGIKPSATSSLLFRYRDVHGISDDEEIARQDFEADTQEEVQSQVEAWAAGQFDRIAKVVDNLDDLVELRSKFEILESNWDTMVHVVRSKGGRAVIVSTPGKSELTITESINDPEAELLRLQLQGSELQKEKEQLERYVEGLKIRARELRTRVGAVRAHWASFKFAAPEIQASVLRDLDRAIGRAVEVGGDLDDTHGAPVHRCASPVCPGFPWKASERRHPCPPADCDCHEPVETCDDCPEEDELCGPGCSNWTDGDGSEGPGGRDGCTLSAEKSEECLGDPGLKHYTPRDGGGS